LSSAADDKKAWVAALKTAATARKLAQGSGWVAVDEGDFLVSGSGVVSTKVGSDGIRKLGWTIRAKPLALDPLLWQTLDPSADMGTPAKQLALRVTGAFIVESVDVSAMAVAVSGPGVDLAASAAGAVDAVETAARTFRSETPDLAAFATLIDQKRAERADLPYLYRLARAFTAVALGDDATAASLADDAIARQEIGFSVGADSVWQLLKKRLDA
jgi:hypothetical protein